MRLDKNSLHLIFNYISKVIVLLAPGLTILEMVFHKGLFSGGILTFTDLILFLIWSVILSAPFFACITVVTALHEVEDADDLNELEEPDFYETALPLTFILMLVNYLSFKAMLSWDWFSTAAAIGIPQRFVLCIIAVAFSLLLSFPVGKASFWVIDRIAISIAKRIRDKGRPTEKI